MDNLQKNILLQVKQGDQIVDLFVKTSAHNVIVDKATGETLKQRLTKIAKHFGDNTNSVEEQINQVKEQVENLIGGAPEAYDTLKEIADYIKTHKEEYNTLKAIAEGIDKTISDKIGDLGKYETVKAYINAQVETVKSAEAARCAQAIAAEQARAEAAEQVNAAAIGVNTAAIKAEVTRAEKAEKDLDAKIDNLFVVFNSIDEYDPEKVKNFGCIFLPDDPVEVETEEQLIIALAENKNVELQNNIVLTQEIGNYSGTIDLNGYELKLGEVDT